MDNVGDARPGGSKGSATSIIKAMRDITPRLLIIDRAVANARVVRRAPESIALTLIVAVGASCFAFEQFYRERVAVLNDRISSQQTLLNDYRTKLRVANPEEAANQIENLTGFVGRDTKELERSES